MDTDKVIRAIKAMKTGSKIINVLDDSAVSNYFNKEEGRETIVNLIRKENLGVGRQFAS